MPKARAAATTSIEFVTQTHPLYDQWIEQWQLSGDAYEGDRGYLDGSHLIPHPREIQYERLSDGSVNYQKVIGYQPKYLRRRQLARYDNLCQALTDILVDHQYAKGVSRTFADPKRPNDDYLRWIQDVDGHGTHLDDWMKGRQTLAHVYGHHVVRVDRGPSKRPDGQPAFTRAEQGDLVLRDYIAPDMLDWRAPNRQLAEVKLVEAVERSSLREPATFAATGAEDGSALSAINLDYHFVDEQTFTVFDAAGNVRRTGRHGFGQLPVVLFYSRPRARIPVIGRMLMRDPRVFRDHFNLTSELRELIRSQTFSLLHVQLGTDETMEAAQSRLGTHAGTDTVIFTMGDAQFIAPADGPAGTIASEIDKLERRMYRMAHLPWDADSKDAESEGSRKLKASDLQQTLAGYADEAEKCDYGVAKLWYIGFYGRQAGLARWAENPPIIRYPDEFNVQEVYDAVEDCKASLGLQLGKTADVELRKRMVPLVLKDLDADTTETINQEIETTPYNPAEAAGQFEQQLLDAQGGAENDGTGGATE